MSKDIAVRLDFRDPLTPSGLTLESIERVVVANTIAEVPAAIAELDAVWDSGKVAIGYIAYEAAPAFDNALKTAAPDDELPLVWFAIGEPAGPVRIRTASGRDLALTPLWDEAAYCKRVKSILQAIRDGETYQLNLTFPLTGEVGAGDGAALYASLVRAQQADFGAHLRTPQCEILSVSPELFFRIEDGWLESRPMKGTRRRGLTSEEDQEVAAELQQNEKEQAENVMIVDLLRNDIGRVAESGTVSVPELFVLERYPTVWQMTSRVRGKLRGDAGLWDILRALFPCGSVTGAPKARTMEWIAASEAGPRGAYCGAIGALLPDRRAVFNVPIRTMTLMPDGRCRYPVGSGVVADGSPADEYRECLAKAAVLGRAATPHFQLLETILWEPGSGYVLMDEHLDRMTDSAEYFGWDFEPLAASQVLLGAQWPKAMRIRLLLSDDGSMEARAHPLAKMREGPVRLVRAKTAVDSTDLFLYHKTTHRAVYDEARQMLEGSDADDVLMFNERGEITETSIGNVAVRLGGEWYTPPVSCGLLAGTRRGVEVRNGRLTERVMTLEDAAGADELAVMNSVRGWQPATLLN
jgi:para-aminobenzoate synthetase/4-amino-4-deoxychorismate lyase